VTYKNRARVVIWALETSEGVCVSELGACTTTLDAGERNAESKEEEMIIYLKRSANWRVDIRLGGG
jgi:hypothetical protein